MDLIARISQNFQDSAQTKLDAIEMLAAPIAGAVETMVGCLVNNGKILAMHSIEPRESQEGRAMTRTRIAAAKLKAFRNRILVSGAASARILVCASRVVLYHLYWLRIDLHEELQ